MVSCFVAHIAGVLCGKENIFGRILQDNLPLDKNKNSAKQSPAKETGAAPRTAINAYWELPPHFDHSAVFNQVLYLWHMYYTVQGEGKAVVLLHGFLEDGSIWHSVAKTLAETHLVLVPDLSGFGHSPLGAKRLSMEGYADDLAAILSDAQIEQCALLGHSMGGYIALHFAEKYPEKLRGFGLINSHCFADSSEKKAVRRKSADFIKKHGAQVFARQVCPTYFQPSFAAKHPSLVAAITAKAAQCSAEALIQATEGMMNRADKAEVLRCAQVPVLLLNGKQDDIAPLSQTLKQSTYPAIADIHFLDNCRHMSIFEKKRPAIQAIADFCHRLS